MLCYTLYIFDRHGSCQYYHEWSRPRSVLQGAGSMQEEFKLLFGLVWSLKALSATIDPSRYVHVHVVPEDTDRVIMVSPLVAVRRRGRWELP